MTVTILLQDIKKLDSEAFAVSFFENVRPLKNRSGELDWLLCGALSNLIIQYHLHGSLGDIALVTSQGKLSVQKIFMVGLGALEAVTSASLVRAAEIATGSAIRAGVKNLVMEFFTIPGMPYEITVPAQLQGIAEGSEGAHITVAMLAPDAAAYEKILRLVREQQPV